jgi:hypothetical protein
MINKSFSVITTKDSNGKGGYGKRCHPPIACMRKTSIPIEPFDMGDPNR